MRIKGLQLIHAPLMIIPLFLFQISCSQGYESADFPSMDKSEIYGEAEQSRLSGSMPMAKDDWSTALEIVESDIQQNQESPDEIEKDRKRLYSGSADLIVEDINTSKREIEQYADLVGGYVESMNAASMVIRIPADTFDQTFAWILEQGKVRYQSIETADVTEAYNDLFSRLEISRTSRNRLYELLARTPDTSDQVLILKEIGRLTEEIESAMLLLQSLESYISYSRIAITLEPRLNPEYLSKQDIPFLWMKRLSPLYFSSNALSVSVELDPGEDFAVFDKEEAYLSESWNGAIIRVSTVENDPVGDGDFWKKALLYHLKEFYKKGEAIEAPFGDRIVYGVLWTSKDRDPFQYFVGVAVDGKDLHLVEIFSPSEDPDLMKRIFAAMKEGGLK
ncbi:MAG: DUF4349 domain-containing protein, partial [Spirochaetaceae bacterium]|nr:DUF4349 domain-containing protein [Spirochaetaceae bacterium]